MSNIKPIHVLQNLTSLKFIYLHRFVGYSQQEHIFCSIFIVEINLKTLAIKLKGVYKAKHNFKNKSYL